MSGQQLSVGQALHLAMQYYHGGQIERAERLLQQVLAVRRDNHTALHLSGVIAYQRGQHAAAVEWLQQALQQAPDDSQILNHLGAAQRALNQLEQGETSCRRSIAANPQYADAYDNLGITLSARGKPAEAEEAFRQALMIRPDWASAHNNLGVVLDEQGRLDDAEASYRQALTIKPDFAAAWCNLGRLLSQQNRHEQAAACFTRALQIRPSYSEAHNNLGLLHKQHRRLDQALVCFQRAVRFDPGNNAAWVNLFSELVHQERLVEAEACCREAGRWQSKDVTWELRRMTLCPTVFADNDGIERYRGELMQWVEQLTTRDLRLNLLDNLPLGIQPPLNLQFHGRDDRRLKEAYARLFRKYIPPGCPPVNPDRPRIGFVVTGGHEHGFLTAIGGIVRRLDPDLLESVVVCSSQGAKPMRAALGPNIVVLELPKKMRPTCDAIRGACCDVLYFWEIGTDTLNYFLPFFCLAPVQCTSWGLQNTSGIAEVDYYLTSGPVETDEADPFYTETLVRLRTLVPYIERVRLPQAKKRREDFGFSGGQTLYACIHQLGKFLPDFDHLLGGILRRDPSGIVVVTEGNQQAAARRLRDRFARSIPDVAHRIVFLPGQAKADYLALLAASDVLLEPVQFGGGFTSYDGFALNKPIVTLPTQFHRGRFTLGCYRSMGVMDCVASDPEHYVQLAVSLGTDRDYRRCVEEKLGQASDALFENAKTVDEHARVFCQLIERARKADR